MKNKLTSIFVVSGGVIATLLLAIGFSQAAQKLDPVAQKSETISTMHTGELATFPCISCGASIDLTNKGGELPA